MKDNFVTYEQALALKELGFNEPCLMAYLGKDKELYSKCDYVLHLNANDVLNPLKAPLKQQVFRWFREKYNIKVSFAYWNGFNGALDEDMGANKYEIYIIPPNSLSKGLRNPKGGVYFDTYEEAEDACIDKLIEIVKTKKL